MFVASDASFEKGKVKAGFLMVVGPGGPKEVRVGRMLLIPAETYELWGDQVTYTTEHQQGSDGRYR